MSATCIVIGASHAGAQLAISLRREGWTGAIVLIGDEPGLAYHRPPLSKASLKARTPAAEAAIFSQAAYEKADITLMPDTRVVRIDRALKQVILASGEALPYDKLALCTGARVRRLTLPGSELAGVHYLRTAADARGIRAQARSGARAVIIGAGYIGLETAAALSELGLHVTLLARGERVLERVTTPAVSAFFAQLHEARGVRILTHVRPLAFQGKEDIEQVLCSDGTVVEADLVVVGIGVVPNLELAREAGLTVGDGILVDDCAQTSDPDIVAVGDCAFHPNAALGFSLRLESVPHAIEQAKSAATRLCGGRKAYCTVPWFWSEQYDSRLQIAGLNRGHDRVLVQRDPPNNALVAWYIQEGRILAADCINSPGQFMRAKKLIAERTSAALLVGEESLA